MRRSIETPPKVTIIRPIKGSRGLNRIASLKWWRLFLLFLDHVKVRPRW